jgi:hypothetical protein
MGSHGFSPKFRWSIRSMMGLPPACIEISILQRNNSAAIRERIGA